MSIVIVTGDARSTTALALALAWPHDALLIEADPRGGILAGWLGIAPSPSLSDVLVAASAERAGETEAPIDVLVACARPLPYRSQVVVGPVRPLEASVASFRFGEWLLPQLVADGGDIIVDRGAFESSRFTIPDAVHLIVHRQVPMGVAGAAARIEQLREQCEQLRSTIDQLALVVIGTSPFDPADVAEHLGIPHAFVLPDDRFAASVLCGRSHCSRRRFAHLPLLRAAAAVGTALAHTESDGERLPR